MGVLQKFPRVKLYLAIYFGKQNQCGRDISATAIIQNRIKFIDSGRQH